MPRWKPGTRASRAFGNAGRWPALLREWWRDAVRLPDLSDEGAGRYLTVAHRIRLAIGLVALAAVPLVGSLSSHQRGVLLALLGGVYLPYALLFPRWARGRERVALRLALVADVGVTSLFSVAVPGTRVIALFGYLLMVAFYAFAGGTATGLLVAIVSVGLATTAEVLSPGDAVDALTVVMFAAVAVIMTILVEAATGERRRAARFLAKLQAAISQVAAVPDLDGTLHSVAGAAVEATGAKFVSVLVRDRAGVSQGALEGDIGGDVPERSSDMIAEILRDPTTSPSGIVLTTGERVVVPSIPDDPRFARWIPETERQGFTATIAVPLQARDGVIGVLAAYFRDSEGTRAENVQLLAAYADHASLVILRALAYEHERRAASRLAEADTIKSDLVATVSHELRTPLTAVKGFIETVLRHWERFDDAGRQDLLERSLRNADQLSGLVDRVLDFSRLEAGAVSVQPAVLELDAELERIIEECSILLEGHPVHLELTPGIRVRGDRDGLEHVLDNLLGNAAKYSPSDAPVTVTTTVQNAEAVIAVSDEGVGISEQDLPWVFERFYRATPGTGPRGTGIGLAIVKRYSALMGGRVWATSTPGKGSSFFLALPLEPAPSNLSLAPPPAGR